MDARPYRPTKHLGPAGVENIPQAKKTLHQRHKSTGNLLNTSTTGSLNMAAKRTALAELNKPSKTHDTSLITTKSHVNTLVAVARGQENQVPANGKEAFLRPAQRPGKAGSLVPSASMNHLRSEYAGSGSSKVFSKPGPSSKNTVVPKAKVSTFVYNDAEAVKEEHPAAAATKIHSLPKTAASNIQQRVSTKSQRKSVLVQPDRPDIEGIVPTNPNSYDYVARQPKEVQQTRRPSFAADTYVKEPHTSAYDSQQPKSSAVVVDDKNAETPYSDAVEELPRGDRHPVQESAEHCAIHVATLPESLVEPHRAAKPETRMVGFEPAPTSLIPIDDQQDLSDYDDEEYYEDQGYMTAHSCRSLGDNTTGGATTIMFPPRLTKRGAAEIQAARDLVESKRTDEDIQEDAWDVSMVAEYGDEIFQYMRELEMSLLPNAHYMDIQGEIQWSMRSVLMDWVIQVHARFSLLPETLFLTVNYIDRFLSCKVVSLGKLQLVGATAIFVAAKYEEINCPSVQEIVYMVDGGYTADEILKAERFMLSMLEFELGWPGPMSFLRRISKADEYDLETRTVAKYFLEVTIMDERFVASPPSYIAAGSHCLSRLVLGRGDWTPAHVHYSGYTYTQLKPLVRMILECCRTARKHHGAVYEKYCDKRYKRASSFVEGLLARGFSLPFRRSISYHGPADIFDEEESQALYADSRAVKMPIPIQG